MYPPYLKYRKDDITDEVGDYKLNEKIDMNSKSWYQSKTVWFNIVVFVVAVLAMPEFVKVLPASWLQYDALIGAIGNWILRVWFTTTPIA